MRYGGARSNVHSDANSWAIVRHWDSKLHSIKMPIAETQHDTTVAEIAVSHSRGAVQHCHRNTRFAASLSEYLKVWKSTLPPRIFEAHTSRSMMTVTVLWKPALSLLCFFECKHSALEAARSAAMPAILPLCPKE